MSKLVLVNRDSQVVDFDMTTHKIIVRIGNEVNQIIISTEGGELAFRCNPSDPAWATNVGIVGKWIAANGSQQ